MPQVANKGQALANFINECTGFIEDQSEREKDQKPKWQLYVNEASNEQGAGAGYVIITPDGHRLHYAMKLGFPTTDNMVEFESMVTGLTLALQLKIPRIQIFSDPQLMANQLNRTYQTKDARLTS